jgi:F-type H+-transporting ATPase subunit b
MRSLRSLVFAVMLAATLPIAAVSAQQHEPARPDTTIAQEPAQHEPQGGEGAERSHAQTWLQTAAKVVNFAILAGALAYFLRTPIAAYLASRATQIRSDLVTAADMRAAASAQLAEIAKKLQSLPTELDALRRQGAADLVAEKERIARQATAERQRLIEQTHREIEMRLRVARRELTEHAAQLAVNLAEQRIRRSITSADQLRLLDRYTAQLQEAR